MTTTLAPAFALRRVDEVTPGLRAELLACWTDVTNAGGAVGFVPPVSPAEVAPALDDLLARVGSGAAILVVLKEPGGIAGFAGLARSGERIRRHVATVQRVQIHPGAQGRGYGTALMLELHRIARNERLELLRLTVWGGTGADRFYSQLGYIECGRLPAAVRLGPGDDRDEVHMFLRL